MRLLQLGVPEGKLDAVQGILDEIGADYVVEDETSGRNFTAVVYVPLPPPAVETVLDELKDAGVGKEYIVIVDANTVIASNIEELQTEWAEQENEERIAHEELRSKANELLPSRFTYIVMTAVSAIVATAGIMMDSAAVVVGSMVIAPLIGPSLAASVGTVLDDRELSSTGIRWQLYGVGLAVASATAFALIIRYVHLVPPGLDPTGIGQVRERLAPDFLALAIAFGAGIAGTLSLTTGVSAALVGVMIAVALIPPAAVIGIGIAWGLPTVVLGSSVLLALNVLAINLAALGVLRYQGYRPKAWFRHEEAKRQIIRRVTILGVAILVISLFLGGVTFASYQSSIQEDKIHGGVTAVLDDPAYTDVTVIAIDIERNDQPIFAQPEHVVVTVARPAGTPPPAIADALAGELSQRLDRAVTVEVRHIERDYSDTSPS